MSAPAIEPKKVAFKLSDRVVGTTDLRRILHELETIDDFLYQANLRPPGTSLPPPKTTKLLADLFEHNGAQILDRRSRENMLTVLKKLAAKAPVMHISFAVEANPVFIEKIVAWARKNINPYVLLDVGLQPSVIVGCNLRTTNKVFDMSLRNRFDTSKYILNEKIEKMGKTGDGNG
ncbi:hypothetical protein KY385_04110 [Candidatus Parcubacteria bacterium]|nr:hypothetical protein [Candidatus Parcubacteria bacterium]